LFPLVRLQAIDVLRIGTMCMQLRLQLLLLFDIGIEFVLRVTVTSTMTGRLPPNHWFEPLSADQSCTPSGVDP
jgi:hypothetical protein